MFFKDQKKSIFCAVFLLFFVFCFTNALAGDQAGSDSYGPTTSNDTLWHIATVLKPEGASVQQTAIALLAANRDAFVSNNVNTLKPGCTLHLPPLDEIQKISTAKASQELDKQDYSWKHHGAKQKSKVKVKAKAKKHSKSAVHKVKVTEKQPAVPVTLPSEPIVALAQPPVPVIPATSVVSSVQTDLVASLTKDLQNLKETTDAKIADLTARNAELEKKISSVDSSVKALQQQFSDLSQKVQKIEKQLVGTFANLAIVIQNLLAGLSGLGIALLILLLVTLFVLVHIIAKICSKWGKRHNSFSKSPAAEIDAHSGLSDESDYDLMGSKEGIASKLDLARVYMDMDESNKARELLQEVMTNGNTKEKTAAEEMLHKIKS